MVSEGAGGRRGVSTGVADERSELAACYQGIPQNDLGSRTDVFDNCPKAAGLMMLIRTMAPRVVAADEIAERRIWTRSAMREAADAPFSRRLTALPSRSCAASRIFCH